MSEALKARRGERWGRECAPSGNTSRSYDRPDSAADGDSGGIVLRIGLTTGVSKAFRAIS